MAKNLFLASVIPLFLSAASPQLRLGYFCHSMFEIVLPSGIRIITDPYHPTTGPDFPTGIVADIVVMSHNHYDHNYSAGVGGAPALVAWTNGSAHGISFAATPTKHFPDGPEGENHIMTWEYEGLKFNHMGDYNDVLSLKDSTALAHTAFLFVPVGGGPTINAHQANGLVNRLSPEIALPMHYTTPEHASGFSSLAATLEQANASFTLPVVVKSSWIAVDPDRLPSGPVIWEPACSSELPGDLEAVRISVLDLHPAPYQITVEVKNNADRPAFDAHLMLAVYDSASMVQADTILASQDPAEDKEYSFIFAPPASSRYTVASEVVFAADGIPPNDTVSAEFDFTAVAEEKPAPALKLGARWLAPGTLVIEYAVDSEHSRLGLYDVNRRAIRRFELKKTGPGVIYWQPERPLAQGVYVASLSTAHGSLFRKLVLVGSVNR